MCDDKKSGITEIEKQNKEQSIYKKIKELIENKITHIDTYIEAKKKEDAEAKKKAGRY